MLLKTLQSNACVNDCSYCPFNSRQDIARCVLSPEKLSEIFIQLLHANRVTGLFLSSAVLDTPNAAMDRMIATVERIRRLYQFRGFIHLKIIPGCDDAAIEKAIRLATRVSVNLETPSAEHLQKLTRKKRFHEDIIAALRTIARLRRQIKPRCKQTSQFVVGAAGESDRQIVRAADRLYRGYDLERVYYSAYQDFSRPAPIRQPMLFDEMTPEYDKSAQQSFIREHRLYQTDFLLRKYGFLPEDIEFDSDGNLSLETDPKTLWASRHPEFFPVDVNAASRESLLRVPGIGPVSVRRILDARKQARFRDIDDLRPLAVRVRAARPFLHFSR